MSSLSSIKTNFSAGDLVIAVDISGYGGTLVQGNAYTVESARPVQGISHRSRGVQMVKLIGCRSCGELFGGRFVPVLKQSMQTNYHNKRDLTGRFTSNKPISTPTVVPAPKPLSPPLFQLRPGSLYRIIGGAIGRYKGTVKGLAVLTVHGKPIAVDENRIRKADRQDVDAYLADSKENK